MNHHPSPMRAAQVVRAHPDSFPNPGHPQILPAAALQTVPTPEQKRKPEEMIVEVLEVVRDRVVVVEQSVVWVERCEMSLVVVEGRVIGMVAVGIVGVEVV